MTTASPGELRTWGVPSLVRLTVALSISPYLGLLSYLRWQMHGESVTATAPGAWFLATVAVLGIVLPALGVVAILCRLIEDRARFLIGPLLQAYGCLVLVFASGYALLQTSSASPSFSGMVGPWAGEATFWAHVGQLHALFLDALYLSVVTITTVGFGDLVPLTVPARLLAATEGLVGIGFVGLVLGHYFSVCTHCARVPDTTGAERRGEEAPL